MRADLPLRLRVGGERLTLRPTYVTGETYNLEREITIRQDRKDRIGRGKERQAQLMLYRYCLIARDTLRTMQISESMAEWLWLGLKDEDWLDWRNLEDMAARYVHNTGRMEIMHGNSAAWKVYDYLNELSPAQRFALADAIEQARSVTYPEPEDDWLTRLKKIGLVKE